MKKGIQVTAEFYFIGNNQLQYLKDKQIKIWRTYIITTSSSMRHKKIKGVKGWRGNTMEHLTAFVEDSIPKFTKIWNPWDG